MRNSQVSYAPHAPFTPADWYWSVGNINADPSEAKRLYSSAERGYVATDAPAYLEWCAVLGHVATNIISEAELRDVLTANGVPLPL